MYDRMYWALGTGEQNEKIHKYLPLKDNLALQIQYANDSSIEFTQP